MVKSEASIWFKNLFDIKQANKIKKIMSAIVFYLYFFFYFSFTVF